MPQGLRYQGNLESALKMLLSSAPTALKDRPVKLVHTARTKTLMLNF